MAHGGTPPAGPAAGGGDDIVAREREFHNRRFARDEGHRREDRFYRALHDLNVAFIETVGELCRGARVLDYGSGDGERAIALARERGPALLVGIDISEEAVRLAGERARGIPSLRFSVDNCERTSLDDGDFDLVYGNGIIHHLDTGRSAAEIRRLLRPGGRMVFYEPLGTNPAINLYRLLTPGSRSPDEHPLLPADLDILRRHLPDLQVRYFGFFTVAALPFYRDPARSRLYRLAARLDGLLFALPGPFRWLAWSIMITARR